MGDEPFPGVYDEEVEPAAPIGGVPTSPAGWARKLLPVALALAALLACRRLRSA